MQKISQMISLITFLTLMGTNCMAQSVANQATSICLNTTITPYACGGFSSGRCILTFHRSGTYDIITFNGSYDHTVVMIGTTRASRITFGHHTYPSKTGGTSYVGAVIMNGITAAAIYNALDSPYPVPTGASTINFPAASSFGVSTIGIPTVTNNGGNRVPLTAGTDGRVTFDLCTPIVGSGK